MRTPLANTSGADEPRPPQPEGRSPYETHHSVVGHHDPNPVGGKRGGTGGGDRLRRSAKLYSWAGRVYPEGRKRRRSGRHYRREGSSPRGRDNPQRRVKLRGEDAVIEAPSGAKADSPCSRTFGPEAICVQGDVNLKTGEFTGPRVSDVSVSGFTIRGFKIKGKGGEDAFVIDVYAARNATVVGNRAIGNVAGGIVAGRSVNTTIAKNHVIGSPKTDNEGIIVGNRARNTTVVKNVVRSIPEGHNAIEVGESIDITVMGNDLISDWNGVFVEDSTGT